MIAATVVEQFEQLPTVGTALIGALATFLAVLAVGVQLGARRLRAELQRAESELVDPVTGLLPRSALQVRLGAELAWAATSRTPLAVAVLRIRGSRFTHAARVLRHSMREEEAAFLLGDQRVAVELWGAEPAGATTAIQRLGEDLARAGHPVVDAGIACAPRDGADVATLVTAAQVDLRPVDDPLAPGDDVDASGRTRGAAGYALALLAGVLPAFAAMGLLLLLAWRLLPAAIEPVLDAGARSGRDLAVALVAAVGLPLGAALLHASCWNLAGGIAPQSRPLLQAGPRTASALALVVGVPLAWGIAAPEATPGGVPIAFGACLAVLALVVLALLHARQLVHVPAPVLAALVLAGGLVTWFAVELQELPVLADAGRLLLAAALGALLARYVERASWILGLALLAAAVDIWSVSAETGVTRGLLEGSGSGGNDRLLELLAFTGPSIDGSALFVIGTTDLVFLALFIAWSHDWRMDLRVVCGLLVAATWAAMLTSAIGPDTVPLLPFLCAAMVLVVAFRSVALRARVTAWRGGRADPIGAAARAAR